MAPESNGHDVRLQNLTPILVWESNGHDVRLQDLTPILVWVNADANNEKAMLKAGAACLLTKEAAVDKLYSAIMKTVGVEIAR
jgi:hypothetical protein